MKSFDRYYYLAVDDSISMNQHVVAHLVALGVPMRNVYTAKNGQEALKVLAKNKIDLVISDYNMPVMTGLELLKAMRADPQLVAVKFMMLTGETEAKLLKECIATGVDSMLLKPFNIDKFKNRVEITLSRIKS